MTPEQRIEALEKEVTQLRTDLATVVEAYSNSTGYDVAFRAAILAIMESAPPNEPLDRALKSSLARSEACLVGSVMIETHLEGMQEGQALIQAAREESARKFATPQR